MARAEIVRLPMLLHRQNTAGQSVNSNGRRREFPACCWSSRFSARQRRPQKTLLLQLAQRVLDGVEVRQVLRRRGLLRVLDDAVLVHDERRARRGIAYARERLQMRSLTGPKAPDKAADPIIVHPDVRRMLLTMKAFAEGNRAMVYFTAKQVDIVKYSQDEEEKKAA